MKKIIKESDSFSVMVERIMGSINAEQSSAFERQMLASIKSIMVNINSYEKSIKQQKETLEKLTSSEESAKKYLNGLGYRF